MLLFASMTSVQADSHLSRQSVYLESASAPMTTMLRYKPVRMYVAADISAMTKPLQAAVMSKAVAFLAPKIDCTCTAAVSHAALPVAVSCGSKTYPASTPK